MEFLSRQLAAVEPLERRRLRSTTPWGAIPRLIRQDVATDTFPHVTGAGESIAILDTGIDYTQPFLGGGFGPGFKVEAGYDFVDDDPDPMDTFGHGTNVAGILGASEFEFNGSRYQGIAPDVNLLAL